MPGWRLPLVALVGLTLLVGCPNHKKKMEEAQKTRDAEKKAYEDAQEAKRKAAIPKIEPAKLEPFWGDESYVRVSTGRPCPEGLWALFPETPGEGAEKDKNEAKRADLAAKVRGQTFVAVLAHGAGVTVGTYNAKKKTLPVEVDGVLECFDGLGILSLAWGTPVKVFRQPGDEDEGRQPQSVWRAQPVVFALPFATAAEAKAFEQKEGIGLEARVVFVLGKTEVDKKLLKPPPGEAAQGEPLDWGAGRVVRVGLSGIRLATDHEKAQIAEQRKK